jgi:intein/homing endonuclease
VTLGQKSETENKDLASLYVAGNTIRRISELTGIPRESLRLRLHTIGVVMRHHPIFYHLPRSYLDSEVGELLGLHAGDGWVSDEWGLAICRSDQTLVRRILVLAREVLGVEPFLSRKSDWSVSVRSGQPQVKAFFMAYGFPKGKKAHSVSVPYEILETNDLEVVRGFLRGLFSADGCFYYRTRQAACVLSVSSPNLRDGFVSLAAKLGFDFHRYSYVHRSGHNKVPLSIAYLGKRDEVLRWMREVGSLKDTHNRKFREWQERLISLKPFCS